MSMPLQLKRLIIANLADDDYIGHQAYWKTTVDDRRNDRARNRHKLTHRLSSSIIGERKAATQG